MPAVFISYRRADSASAAGRMDDQLVARFGRAHVFKDVDSIPPGVNFEHFIEDAIGRSSVVLVLIGPRWLNATAGALRRRRLDDPGDFVRIEIETALRLGVPIIPVPVENASMPPAARLPVSLRPLASLNALSVRPDPDFHRDMERVGIAVERAMTAPQPAPPQPARAPEPEPAAPDPEASGTAPTQPKLSAIPRNLPSARPFFPPGAREERKAPARPTRSRDKRQPPTRMAVIVSVVALVALTATLLLKGKAEGFLAGPGRVDATATASAVAFQRDTVATETAQARQLTQPYAPTSFGPCAPNGERYTDDFPYYWKWTSDAGQSVTCDGGAARINGGGTLSFNGFPGGFAPAFTATITVAPHPGYSSSSCLYYSLGDGDRNPGLYLCGDGSWCSSDCVATPAPIARAATYTLNMSVANQHVSFSVNNQTLTQPIPFANAPSAIMLSGSIPKSNWYSVTRFAIIPTAG